MEILWHNRSLTVDQIMEADLEILGACHGWLYYYFDESQGCLIEAERAHELELPHEIIVSDIAKLSTSRLRSVLTPFVIEAVEYFRRQNNV